ncbi:MAG: HAD hydrolase family protein [Phycisphaerales bacterium]|nr:HAD hydrolase family protein [Phycisphaerales bacterium]
MTDPKNITLLALDVDGVLTDGTINIDADGHEFKSYNVRDGFALRLWEKMGLSAAIITGRTSQSVLHRMADLRVPHVIQGSRDKGDSLGELCRVARVNPDQVAFLGDDWPDLSVMRRVGYPMAVGDASEPVKRLARFTTKLPGGRGAVREAVEHLLEAKGLLDKALALYDR